MNEGSNESATEGWSEGINEGPADRACDGVFEGALLMLGTNEGYAEKYMDSSDTVPGLAQIYKKRGSQA